MKVSTLLWIGGALVVGYFVLKPKDQPAADATGSGVFAPVTNFINSFKK